MTSGPGQNGRPTTIHGEERSLHQVLRQISENPRFAQVVSVNPELIEGTAEEVPLGVTR
jgi:hypothetical protein